MLAATLLLGGPALDLILGGTFSGVHLVLSVVGLALVVMASSERS